MQQFINKNTFIGLILFFSSVICVFAQANTDVSLTEILDKAGEQRKVYVEEFKNLLSQETKSFEIYGKNGDVKKSRTILSTFIVYQLSKDDLVSTEYRNVISVDGKDVDKADKRAEDFFTDIVKVESSKKELDKLQNESSRFDLEIYISELTLFQSVALAENIRPFFDFTLEGKETIDGSPVYVISYRQTKTSPFILASSKKESPAGQLSVNYDAAYDGKGDLNERLSGKFWIDAQTFQIYRELRSMTLKPEGFTSPALLLEEVFEFQKSDFGILTPKLISHTQYQVQKKEKASVKEAKVTFKYDKFTKPDVEVKSDEIKK